MYEEVLKSYYSEPIYAGDVVCVVSLDYSSIVLRSYVADIGSNMYNDKYHFFKTIKQAEEIIAANLHEIDL